MKEKERLEKRIVDLQKQIKLLPRGKLIVTHNGKYDKWYMSDGKNYEYIPKKDKSVAEDLALKKFLTLQLENCTNELNAVQNYLINHDLEAYQKEKEIINSKDYSKLIHLDNPTFTEEIKKWVNKPYQKNPKYQEGLTYKTYSGIYVRSKSEALIEMFLYKNQIPFRYEELLQLGDIDVYPDFTILHPKTLQVYYWEHFGAVDLMKYSRDTFAKLQLYTLKDILPGNQLITTFETKSQPLTPEKVERIIEQYFL